MQTLHKVEAIHFISALKKTAVLCRRIPKGKNGRETTEKQLKTAKNHAKKTGQQRKHYRSLARKSFKNQGPVPERRNNSIPGINVPYFRDNFIPGINSVPERRNTAIKGINLG